MKFKWVRDHTRKTRAAARTEARKIKKEQKTKEWKGGLRENT